MGLWLGLLSLGGGSQVERLLFQASDITSPSWLSGGHRHGKMESLRSQEHPEKENIQGWRVEGSC